MRVLRTLGLCAVMALPATADIIVDWAEVTLDAIRTQRQAPVLAARSMAMVGIAMYDSVNFLDRGHEPYLDLSGILLLGPASAEAAVACAAHTVLSNLYPDQAEFLDAEFATSLAAIPDGLAKTNGLALGLEVGTRVLALRANDGSSATVPYVIGDQPGDWQPTPPAFVQTPLQPHWPDVTPFCLPSGSALRRNPPPALDSFEYTVAFNEVKAIGSADSTVRTVDQTQIAFFWVDGPGTATPPGHWWQIARDVGAAQGNTLVDNARLFALIGLAVADAGICSWDAKYAYNFWRPVTAIRAADTDGNPDTEADPGWTSLIPTPPFPAYTSGHSTFSSAASKILALFYGRDDIAFTTTSDDVPGVSRSYASFSAAGDEAGRSRIYGGIHWEFDNVHALANGRELAGAVFADFLQPRDRGVVVVPLESVLNCGLFGLVPLMLLAPALLGLRVVVVPRRRR